ncbi:MAG: Maf family nucleotide pyrophosphatase [Paracoccaceae bacterium]
MKQLILASGSGIRAEMLRSAGVPFDTVVVRVDEETIKATMLAEGAKPRGVADMLAEMKARRVAQKYPEALVLGADQVLVSGGVLFDKPTSIAKAREQLIALRGNTHELLSAAVIYEDGTPVWRHIGRAQLMMRPFSDVFLENYIKSQSEELFTTVGGYKLEKEGSQLFTRVQGDYFSVLGLPLLEILGFLRTRGICQE